MNLHLISQWILICAGISCTAYAEILSEQDDNLSKADLGFVIVILSQPNTYHVRKAHQLKQMLLQQINQIEEIQAVIHLLHQEWPEQGAWTIFPTLSRLAVLHSKNTSWILFIEDSTEVHLPILVDLLKAYNPMKDWFLGHALFDQDATIIHHFAFHDNPGSFPYPDFATGFLFSISLLKKLAHSWETKPDHLDFSIDPKHELAMYLMQHLQINLTHVPQLCLSSAPNCATVATSIISQCGQAIEISEIYFAVKTCTKFHSERVNIVKNTWAKDVRFIGYFSDGADPKIPSINLQVPNTERGHCAKTLAILEYAAQSKNISDKAWLVLADDDTLISIPRLQQTLSCYDAMDSVVLGERYGFSVTSSYGYNYITGGGGIVFTMSVVKQLVDSGLCVCPSNSTPDDMFIGICLKRLGIPVVHLPVFHQARPVDYAKGYLSHQSSVSFHKHWMVDPIRVYKDWLQVFEESTTKTIHTEL